MSRLIALFFVLVSFAAYAGQTLQGMAVKLGDNASSDPASRLRVSDAFPLFEDSRQYTIGSMIWEDVASGVGASAVLNTNEGTVSLTVGTGASDFEFRQTRYLPYAPGKGQLIKETFLFGAGVTNVIRRVGYYDDSNGLFFQQASGVLSMCVRTATSGSPVDTCTPQSSWNLDTLDGAGPSGLTLDITKTQLLQMDFLWQGVGRIRFGFQLNGATVYVHQIMNANSLTVPFIATASLPLRYEIRNSGASAGASMKQICVAVDSEGGYLMPGFEYATSNGITTVAVTTRAPVLGIRLAATYNGLTNRKTARILHSSYLASTNNAYCELVHAHGVTSTTGGTWVSVGADSAVEVNTGLTAVSAAAFHTIDGNLVSTGQGNASSTLVGSLDYLSNHSFISRNYAATASQMFVVYCTSFTGTSNVSAELNWIEAK